jgi:sugar transferase (PEP-CTERM/EpsH1 system associated)
VNEPAAEQARRFAQRARTAASARLALYVYDALVASGSMLIGYFVSPLFLGRLFELRPVGDALLFGLSFVLMSHVVGLYEWNLGTRHSTLAIRAGAGTVLAASLTLFFDYVVLYQLIGRRVISAAILIAVPLILLPRVVLLALRRGRPDAAAATPETAAERLLRAFEGEDLPFRLPRDAAPAPAPAPAERFARSPARERAPEHAAGGPLRILFITARFPSPMLRGDQLRAYHQLRVLGRKHRVTLLYFSNARARAADHVALADYCERIIGVPLGPAQMARGLLRRVFSDVPLQTALYESSAMRRAVRDVVRGGCDLVHVQLARMAPYLEEDFDGPRVIDLVDALSLNMRRRSLQDHPLARWLLRVEAGRLKRYERRVCVTADRAVVVSQRDREEIGVFPSLSIVNNGVDLARFPFQRDGRDRHTVVFTGNMGYFPNANAVVWFVRHVLPRIREVLPQVRFQIVGVRPTREVQRLAAHDANIDVSGYVDDVGTYLRRSAVAVAPLRAGSGQPLKVLEAMASGTPVVATAFAAGSLEATGGEHLLVADDPGAFAERTLSLLRDESLSERLAHSARRLVEEKYTWERSVADLEQVYRVALDHS